jgi:hypothetical protein
MYNGNAVTLDVNKKFVYQFLNWYKTIFHDIIKITKIRTV